MSGKEVDMESDETFLAYDMGLEGFPASSKGLVGDGSLSYPATLGIRYICLSSNTLRMRGSL
jgi:hypothetical protein